MPLPTSPEQLREQLEDNDNRIFIFRQLASYQQADSFESWCRRWNASPLDEAAFDHWYRLHQLFAIAWNELGEEFWKYLSFGGRAVLAMRSRA